MACGEGHSRYSKRHLGESAALIMLLVNIIRLNQTTFYNYRVEITEQFYVSLIWRVATCLSND